MIAIALFLDAVQFVLAFFVIGLVINRVIIFFAWVAFWFWFKSLGVKLLGNTKKRVATIGGMIAEALPIIGALPAFTLALGRHIALSMVEDKAGIGAASIKKPSNIVNISRARKAREMAGAGRNVVTPSRISRIQRGRRELRKAA